MKGRYIFIAILLFITGIVRTFDFRLNMAAVPDGNAASGIVSIVVPFVLAAVAVCLEIRIRRKEK